jgi:hypothetical protein
MLPRHRRLPVILERSDRPTSGKEHHGRAVRLRRLIGHAGGTTGKENRSSAKEENKLVSKISSRYPGILA